MPQGGEISGPGYAAMRGTDEAAFNTGTLTRGEKGKYELKLTYCYKQQLKNTTPTCNKVA